MDELSVSVFHHLALTSVVVGLNGMRNGCADCDYVEAGTLSSQVVQRRVDLLAAEGITFKTGVQVGKTVSARSLMTQFDAAVLCMGSTWPRDLPIPGKTEL